MWLERLPLTIRYILRGAGGINHETDELGRVTGDWGKLLIKKPVVISSGAVLQFSLQQPLTVTLPPQ